MTAEPWPPDYVAVFKKRAERLAKLRNDPLLKLSVDQREGKPTLWESAIAYYSTRPADLINDWGITVDPRNAANPDLPTTLPFILFKRQREFVDLLHIAIQEQANVLAEKARDMGATWLCVGFSVWAWRFLPGAAIGWGSRKEDLVDKLGDPKSIFEKVRLFIAGLPRELRPMGFVPKRDATFMTVINPDNGSTIIGESGDNIGRGGRTLFYMKDEAAHYERPERIEAALGDNTNVQIDISSVNGLGNVFHRKREAGEVWEPSKPLRRDVTNVFIFDVFDHPAKDQRWYDERKAKAEAEGMLHIFYQEIDRNYAASVSGVVIQAEHFRACIDAHLKLGFDDSGGWMGALDVADSDSPVGDQNAQAFRRGVVLKNCEAWGERDTGETTRRFVTSAAGKGPIDLQYDCIGIGSGVKAEANRLVDEGLMPHGLRLVPWDAGSTPRDPDKPVNPHDRDSPTNKDHFENLKAQAWIMLARRIEKTWRMVTKGVVFPHEELISFDSTIPDIRQIEKELCQVTQKKSGRLKLMINKAPEGTRSPNRGDAIVMCFWPAPKKHLRAFSSFHMER